MGRWILRKASVFLSLRVSFFAAVLSCALMASSYQYPWIWRRAANNRAISVASVHGGLRLATFEILDNVDIDLLRPTSRGWQLAYSYPPVMLQPALLDTGAMSVETRGGMEDILFVNRLGFGLTRVDCPTASVANARMPGSCIRCIAIPYWAMAVASCAFAAVVARPFVAARRRDRLRVAGLCIACGYDLCVTPDRCPECGMSIRSTGDGTGEIKRG